jgi:hypothetical protein
MKLSYIVALCVIATVRSQNVGDQQNPQVINGNGPQNPGINSPQMPLGMNGYGQQNGQRPGMNGYGQRPGNPQQGMNGYGQRPGMGNLQGMISGMRPGQGMSGQRPGMPNFNIPGMIATGAGGAGLSSLGNIINILPPNIQNLPPVRLFLTALRAYLAMMPGIQAAASIPSTIGSATSMANQLSNSASPGQSQRVSELNDLVIAGGR